MVANSMELIHKTNIMCVCNKCIDYLHRTSYLCIVTVNFNCPESPEERAPVKHGLHHVGLGVCPRVQRAS